VQIFPEKSNGPTEIHILNRHLYRTSKAEDEDKPAIIIPFSNLRRTINNHEEQQCSLEIALDKKRRHAGKDSSLAYDGKSGDKVVRDIERLKKPRVK
jgi:hypothetical protein